VARARDDRSISSLRVLLATAFGLAAACWPFDDAEREFAAAARVGRVDLLSPRGRLDRTPRFVRWSTTRHGARFRVRVLDARGKLLFERDTDDPRARGVQLTGCERSAWEGAAVCRVEVDLASGDGELIAASDSPQAWVAPRVGSPANDAPSGYAPIHGETAPRDSDGSRRDRDR
jgi:hypothetical protein